MAAIVDLVMVPENGPVRLLAITEIGDLANSENVLEDSSPGDTDSGHWSVDYDFPCSHLTNEELLSEFSDVNSTSSGSPRTSLNGTATCTPSIKSCESLSSISNAESERVDPLEPAVALLEAEPVEESPAELPGTEESLCIVCFDPEVVEVHHHYDDYYDYYYEEQSATETTSSHLTLSCCKKLLCKECMKAIIHVNVSEGRVQISCPHPECGKPLPKNEVTLYMDAEIKTKYERFLVDMDGDGNRKTCPNCCEITEHHIHKSFRLQEQDLKITCKSCDFEWCFRCHSPWHKGLSCRNFRNGDRDFRKWTKGKNKKGVNNCQKCPTCRVWIERSSGCIHMTCGRCHTHFCYYCGKRFLELGIIDHDSDLNVWGCDQNLLPNRPTLRRFVRSSYLGVKVSYLAGYPVLLVGAAVLLVVGGAVVLPIYGGYKLYRLNQYRRKSNSRKRRH